MEKLFRVRRSYSLIGLLLSFAVMTFTGSPATEPVLSRVYGSRFVGQEQQYNDAGILGLLNHEYGECGNLNVTVGCDEHYAIDVVTLANGSMYVLLSNGGCRTTVAKFSSIGVLDTTFNSPHGYYEISGEHVGPKFINLDGQGRILVGGGECSSSNGWMIRIDPAHPCEYITFAGGSSFVGAVAQQTTGRYIAVGQSAPYYAGENLIPAYTQVIGYNEDGTTDGSFGDDGYLLFYNGSVFNGQNGYLYGSVGAIDLAVDACNNIYVAYADATDGSVGYVNLVAFNADGLVTDFAANVFAYGDGDNQILDNQVCINLDSSCPQNLIVAGTLATTPTTIGLVVYTANNFAGVSTIITPIATESSLQVVDILALNNQHFAVVSNDVSCDKIRVDQFEQGCFGYDRNFNPGCEHGHIEFKIACECSAAYGATIGEDGQLYIAGSQCGTTPYLSKIYDYQYVGQVTQYPATKLQGNFDVTFGKPECCYNRRQAFPGVDYLYHGKFGQALNQQTRGIIELQNRDLLVGADGLVDCNAYNSMMFTWLRPNGDVRCQRTLDNYSNSNEWMAGFAAGTSGTLYVAGSSEMCGYHAFLRAYDAYGCQSWVSSPQEARGSYAAGIAIQGSDGILLFVQDADDNHGHISRYTLSGDLDTENFGCNGHVNHYDFGLMMGPVYNGGLVNPDNNIIYIAYTSSCSPHYINVAAINRDGKSLVSGFADGGIAYNVFDIDYELDPWSVWMSFDNQNNLIVGASNTNAFWLRRLDSITGAVDPAFNNGNILSTQLGCGFLYLSNIVGMSNGKFMLTGTNYGPYDYEMVVTRITDEGVLDTTFNPQGEIPGILQYHVADEEVADYYGRSVSGLAIQSGYGNLGNLVLSSYEILQEGLAIPEALRVYGQPRTTQVQRFPTQDQYPGTPDLALNNAGAFNLNNFVTGSAVGKVVYAYPAESEYDGMMLVGIDFGGSTQIVRFNSSSLTMDPSFGTNGIYTINGYGGINSIIVDKHQRIVVCGTIETTVPTQGWALYLDQDGQDAPVYFNMPASIIAANMIYQQQSGRFIIAASSQSGRFLAASSPSGSNPSVGTLIAFQDRLICGASTLAVDATFNPLATNSVAGQWNMQSTGCPVTSCSALYNLVINDDDTIYVAYQDLNNSPYVQKFAVSVAKILADGSGFDQGFHGMGVRKTDIIPDSAQVVCCVVDDQDNIIAAASANNTLQLIRFTPDGCSYAFTPTAGTTPSITVPYLLSSSTNILVVPSPLMGTAGVALTDVITTNLLTNSSVNGIILLGTNTANGNQQTNYGNLFAVRLLPSGDFDVTWNPYPGTYPTQTPNVPGVLTYGDIFSNPSTSVATPLVLQYRGVIDIGGNLWTTGASFDGYNNYPALMEVTGYPYLQNIPQTQIAGDSGVQDNTLWSFGNEEAVSVLNVAEITFPNLYKMSIAPDGSFLIGSGNSEIVNILKCDATLNNNANPIFSVNFGTGDYPYYTTLNDMFAGFNNTYMVTGSDGCGKMWAGVAREVDSVMTPVILPVVDGWTTGTAIRQAVNGDILVAGYNGTNGAIVAFLPNYVQIDPLFGVNGVYTTDSSWQIADMAVDNYSRIYIAYKDCEFSGKLSRLLADGSGLDPYFCTKTFENCDDSEISLALDIKNNQIIVASYYSDNIQVHRYSTIDGCLQGCATIHIRCQSLDLLNVFVNEDREIYVIATITDGCHAGNAVVARLNSTSCTTIALDTSYAWSGCIPGIADINTGLVTVADGALSPDRRVYVIGQDSTPAASVVRIFGNNYYPSVPQSIEGVVLGELDYTYGYDGANTPFAGSEQASQIASTILPITHGSNVLVTVEDLDLALDTQGSWTVRLLPNGTFDPNYGDGQGVQIAQLPGLEYTHNMIFDGFNNAISCGVNTNGDIVQGFIKSVTPNGSMDPAFGGLNGNPQGTVYFPTIFTIDAIAELSNGNFVFVGSDGQNGKVGMTDVRGALLTTFGTNGFVNFGSVVSSVSVDINNNIYVVYGDINSNVSVAKLNSNGRLVRTFGNNGIAANVLTNIINIIDIIYVEMVLDAAGNIVVVGGTVDNDASLIEMVRLTPAGIIDTTFGTAGYATIPFEGNLSLPTSLVALNNGQYLVAGLQLFENQQGQNYEFLLAVTAAGVLDVNFNPFGATPGIAQLQVSHRPQIDRDALNISVQTNGQILLAGCEESAYSGEFTPITMRINGYPNVQAVRQYPPLVVPNVNQLNTEFGNGGLCVTGMIPELINGGSNAVDSLGNILVGGITTSGDTFVVARFLPSGVLDTAFNVTGISQTPTLSSLSSGSFISLDGSDNVYIGGMTSDSRLMVARFLSVDGSLDVAGFNPCGYGTSVSGVAQSCVITNLNDGGYTTIDYLGNVVVGGSTSDFQLVVARFTSAGHRDECFGSCGVAYSGAITTNGVISLTNGGFVTTDQSGIFNNNDIYVGGITTADTLVVAKFRHHGCLDECYGTSGIAQSVYISALIEGGAVALDNHLNAVVGGYTTNQQFVVARFTPEGIADSAFNDGIAYSSPLTNINGFAGLAVDTNNNVLLGGTSVSFDDVSTSMVVARISPMGILDTTYGINGVVSTGTISGITLSSGFVAIDPLSRPIVGGFDSSTPQLVIGEFYTGAEVFITRPQRLTGGPFKLYWYANNPALFQNFLAIDFYAGVIADPVVKADVISRVVASYNEYVTYVENTPSASMNLAGSLGVWNGNLAKLETLFGLDYSGSNLDDIANFLTRFRRRLTAISNEMTAANN